MIKHAMQCEFLIPSLRWVFFITICSPSCTKNRLLYLQHTRRRERERRFLSPSFRRSYGCRFYIGASRRSPSSVASTRLLRGIDDGYVISAASAPCRHTLSIGDATSVIRCLPGEDATNGFFVSCFIRKPGKENVSSLSSKRTGPTNKGKTE